MCFSRLLCRVRLVKLLLGVLEILFELLRHPYLCLGTLKLLRHRIDFALQLGLLALSVGLQLLQLQLVLLNQLCLRAVSFDTLLLVLLLHLLLRLPRLTLLSGDLLLQLAQLLVFRYCCTA